LKDFKVAYSLAPGGKYNLSVPVPYLEELAEGYLAKYEETGNWADILRV